MKRLVYATTEESLGNGFLLVIGNKAIFLKSQNSNITDKIVRKFINAVCDLRNVGDKIRESALYDPATLKDFRRRIDKASLVKKDTGNIVYYTISSKGSTMNFPEEDFEEEVIVIEDKSL